MPLKILGPTKDTPRETYRIARVLTASRAKDEITLYSHGAHYWVMNVEGEDGHTAEYAFDFISRRVAIWFLGAPDEPGTGWGTKKFLALTKAWKKAGFKIVHASPADGPNDGYTGYYFWPRVGFKGQMSKEQAKKLATLGFEVKSRKIEDLFAMPGGPEVWKKHGSTLWGLIYAL